MGLSGLVVSERDGVVGRLYSRCVCGWGMLTHLQVLSRVFSGGHCVIV